MYAVILATFALLVGGTFNQEGTSTPKEATAPQVETVITEIDLDGILKEFQRLGNIDDEKAHEVAEQRLLSYIDTLEAAIEKAAGEPEKLQSLKQKRDIFVEKVGKIMDDNATTIVETWGDTAETVLSGKGHYFSAAAKLLVRINDAKVVDKLVGHIDKHWSASRPSASWTGGGLLFHRGWRYPFATTLSRCPERCRSLVIMRLVEKIKETDDVGTGRSCVAVLIELRDCAPTDTIAYLNDLAEKEKDEAKKKRLKKRTEDWAEFRRNLLPGEDGRGGLAD